MPICNNCKSELEENAKFCPSCGAPITTVTQRTDVMSALKKGIDILTSKPTVLLPAIVGALITIVLSWMFLPGVSWLTAVAMVVLFVGTVLTYILSFASLDMSRDAYLNQEPNLSESINYVLKRLLTFIVASIVGAVLSITIILIPVALLMFVIMVVDETGIGSAISTAFQFLGQRLVDVIIILVISIAGNVILGLVPFIGSILTAAFNVLIQLTLIDIYHDFKRQG